MIVGAQQMQGKGKTMSIVALVLDLLDFGGYQPHEVYSVVTLRIPGTHKLTMREMRAFVRRMVDEGLTHLIIVLDEVDRVFPARFFRDPEQTEALIGLWQDEKLFNWILWTAHGTASVDKIIRDATQVQLVPEYDAEHDVIEVGCANGITGEVEHYQVRPASLVMEYYDRWEPVR